MTARIAKKMLRHPWRYRKGQVERALAKQPPLFRVIWRETEHKASFVRGLWERSQPTIEEALAIGLGLRA